MVTFLLTCTDPQLLTHNIVELHVNHSSAHPSQCRRHERTVKNSLVQLCSQQQQQTDISSTPGAHQWTGTALCCQQHSLYHSCHRLSTHHRPCCDGTWWRMQWCQFHRHHLAVSTSTSRKYLGHTQRLDDEVCPAVEVFVGNVTVYSRRCYTQCTQNSHSITTNTSLTCEHSDLLQSYNNKVSYSKQIVRQHSWSTCKSFLTSILITIQNMVHVSRTVCKFRRSRSHYVGIKRVTNFWELLDPPNLGALRQTVWA